MEGSVKLTYGDMRNNCTTINGYADEYESTSEKVNTLVSAFTGSWEGEAEAKFEEDYNVLTNAMKTAVDTMREITTLVMNYVESMEEIESSYGHNHVSVG